MDFHFTNELHASRLDEAVAFLRGPRLWVSTVDYPDFDAWADRTHAELRSGAKRAMIGVSQGDVVGMLVYQRHKRMQDTLELKNLTVRPDQRGRYLASFLLRNAELEGVRSYGCRTVVADAKTRNAGIHFFMLRHRYRVAGHADLYGLGAGNDVIYRKQLVGLANSPLRPLTARVRDI